MEWIGGNAATDMTDKWQGLGSLELWKTWTFKTENKSKAGAAGTLAENYEILELT